MFDKTIKHPHTHNSTLQAGADTMKKANILALITLATHTLESLEILGADVDTRNLWVDTKESLQEVREDLTEGDIAAAKSGLVKVTDTLYQLEKVDTRRGTAEVTLETRAHLAIAALSVAAASAIRFKVSILFDKL